MVIDVYREKQQSECDNSLCGGVVQLVLSGPGEAGLNPSISPQSGNDIGQFIWQRSLFLCRPGQGKQLSGIIL